jgi:hypothetical protein
MKDKIYKNALRYELINKLSTAEKQTIVNELLKNSSYRKLEEELNIPKSTLQLWANPITDNSKPINFNTFYNKLKIVKAEDIKDWGRLEQIRNRINILLLSKKY